MLFLAITASAKDPPADPDALLAGRLLVLDKPAPDRLPVGYQALLSRQHRESVKGSRAGWTLHLFAHLHAGDGRLDRARIEVYQPEAKGDDPPLFLYALDLLQHDVRMSKTIQLRRDPTFRRGQSYRLVVVVPGPTPQRLVETVITLR